MNPILPSGAFFPQTADGYLLNPCTVELVDKRYLPVLQKVVSSYVRMEGANLHSVYLRGSVARGMNIGDCDLDTFALVFTESDRWKKPDWAKKENRKLLKKYPFLTDVEFYTASYAPVLRSLPEYSGSGQGIINSNLAMIIKTQSLCLHGNDISQKIPPYRPDEKVLLSHCWLKSDIAAFKAKSKSGTLRQQVLKTMLRSGFELVVPRIRQYTPDLYLCYRSFSEYYPKKGKWMRSALYAYLNPQEIKVEEVYKIVDKLGPWLGKQFKKTKHSDVHY